MIQSLKFSIKRKVMAMLLLASTVTLLLTVFAFVTYEETTFRQNSARNLASEGQLIAENCSAALAFNDENDASNVLKSLHTETHVVAAAIYDAKGRLFAKYPANLPDAVLPAKPETWNYRFGKQDLNIFEPVVREGAPLGTVFIRSDLKRLASREKLYALISLFIMFGSLVVAAVFSNLLQQLITKPIITLSKTALSISEHQDYSTRASISSSDEIGLLAGSFNKMLDRIENSDAQLRLVTDGVPVLLAHIDRDYRYKFVNKPYAAHFGLSPAQIVGKHVRDILGDTPFEEGRSHMEKALAGQPVQFELESLDAREESRWSHVEYTPEKNSAGDVMGFVSVHVDITLRRKAEMEMENARDQALAASRAKDDFLAALSHELRTPLNPVLLIASDAAANPSLPDAIRKDFETIGKNVELEARLIDDLLDLTRIIRGKLSLNLRVLNAHDVLQDAIANIRPQSDEKQIDLALDLQAQPSNVKGDAVRLQQIFWNVLRNAVKFTPAKGKITIATSTENGRLILKITDTGIGLTSEEISRVFKAFSQGDHAADNYHRFGGLGLGLTISRQLVELHSGRIYATSAGRDQGAIFTIELNLASDP